MSFWAGVVQGVKDIDVLKEKEALADERQSVRDQENAYREQIRLYNEKRDGIADARNAALDAINVEKWGFEKAQMGQSVLDAANGLGIGGPTATGGGGGGGSVPTPDAIKDSGVKFGGWLDTQLSDETLSQEDVDYLTNVSESFVDPKDAHEYWSVVTGIRETTGQMPTVAQLRASVTVTQVPGYADNKQKAVETLAAINSLDVSTPEGLSQATTLYNQLKRIDLNAATIDADTSSFLNAEDLGKLHTQQVEILDTELATNWLSESDKSKLDLAKGVSKDILMADFRKTYGPRALEALTGLYPQQFNRYADNPAFRTFISGPSSNTPVQGGGNGTDGGTGTVDTAAIFADLSKDPNNTELQRMVVETVGPEVFNSMMQQIERPAEFASGFTPSTEFSTGEAGGGAYGITPDNLEYTGGRDRAAPDAGDVAAGFTVRTPYTGMSLKDSAAELARLNAAEVTDQDAIDNLIEYMNDTWDPEDVSKAFEYIDNQGPLPTPPTSPKAGRNLDADNLIGFNPESGGYTPTQMGATELNLPKVLEALSPETRKVVEAELQTMPEEVARSEGYRPVQIGATELNLPKVLDGLSAEAMKLVESDLQAFAEQPARSEGYRPPEMGATELNLPKILEALSPETRKIVEAELQVTSGDTNLGRMEQSRLDRVGMESDRLSTESKSMPNGYTPTQMGATELNSPKVRSALDSVTAEYVAAKGEPLAPEEELAIGIEAIVKGLSGNGMDQAELDDLIIELQEKFGDERVQEALVLAMNQ